MKSTNLSVGMLSDDVAILQKELKAAGFDIPDAEIERSFFGAATRRSVLQFQRGHGLPATGIADERTRAAINPASSTRRQREPGMSRGKPSPSVERSRIGLVLSGWAPAMTLMSGAMLGFMEKGVEFDVISTSGVGALIGLLYLAPKGKTAKAALEELPNLFVSDLLYSLLPVNFKLFFRFGAFAEPMYKLRKIFPRFPVDPD